ncbi:MAG: hypothetical protein Q8867_11550, partial [Bacteroidota bacterium]|nr:hypothetical protein [Bacteroidota bacterium]
GTLAGEGSSYFVLSKNKNDHSYARLQGVKTIFHPTDKKELEANITGFLDEHGLKPGNIGLLITGINGNATTDEGYHELAGSIFPGVPLAWFKHLCGEYSTASGFALWLATRILKSKTIPKTIMLQDYPPISPEHILILNSTRDTHYSLILVSIA